MGGIYENPFGNRRFFVLRSGGKRGGLADSPTGDRSASSGSGGASDVLCSPANGARVRSGAGGKTAGVVRPGEDSYRGGGGQIAQRRLQGGFARGGKRHPD